MLFLGVDCTFGSGFLVVLVLGPVVLSFGKDFVCWVGILVVLALPVFLWVLGFSERAI